MGNNRLLNPIEIGSDRSNQNNSQEAKVHFTFKSDNCIMTGEESKVGDMNVFQVWGVSTDDGLLKLLSGEKEKSIVELFFRAVNNRTIERDFFKLYCNLLDNTITEEEYEQALNEKENDYIVDESMEPTPEIIDIALGLSKGIRGVDSLEDLCSLFSFNNDYINRFITCKK